jgi:hypothetical protein
MARSSLALDSCWRDLYGNWNALVEPLMAPIEDSVCHAPRYVLLPDPEHANIQPSGKLEYNFRLVPGSLIVGLWVPTPVEGDQPFVIQLTDIDLEHQFFQEPVNCQFLNTLGAQFGRFPSVTLLPCPHPVVGDAFFSLEVWGTAQALFNMVLLVAEVTDCPVR